VRERLAVTLSVTLGGTAHAIPGGNVRGFSLTMSSWGVEGWVEFVVQDDQGRSGKYRDEVLADIKELAAGGAFGSIMGRNAFQRPRAESLKLLADIMTVYKNA